MMLMRLAISATVCFDSVRTLYFVMCKFVKNVTSSIKLGGVDKIWAQKIADKKSMKFTLLYHLFAIFQTKKK